MDYKKSVLGSSFAFIIATSCCWLPALIVAIGGGTTLVAFSNGLEKYSGIFFVIGIGLLGIGFYQYRKSKSKKEVVTLVSIITCPECGASIKETMPTNACQYFYECNNCQVVLKPVGEDCCVFCSYGTVPCPPVQLNQDCC